MKYLYLVCRILLGLMFAVFGFNGLHPFMPMQMPPTGSPAYQFMTVMSSSGWLHHVAALEVLGGILVLIGGTAPIGLVILGPIIFNAMLFHILFIHGVGITASLVAFVMEVVLIYGYRPYFSALFTTKATTA